MTDEILARTRTYRNNIARYNRILRTELTDLERSYIQRRLSEETAALGALASQSIQAKFGCRPSGLGSPSTVP
ncbi:hypothetical protein RPMA_12040 [Tardiphaga alba]|uniref:Uncharacterized protein n=1 Tax=Tardiphaga alba TaxID=340268 RepID=A0ABX8AJ51_9BRAD|nr:hypothetical protein RPMA_12040 [Tardiphaga alba]